MDMAQSSLVRRSRHRRWLGLALVGLGVMLVLLIAKEQSLCVCEMTYALEESQPEVSRHLAQLRQCGLLMDQREGQWVYYRLAPQLPAWAQSIIESAAQGSAVQLNALTQRLTRMGDRPARRAALC